MSEKQDILKQNISRLTHTIPGGLNEKRVLNTLSMSALSRRDAINVLLELLNTENLKKKNE